MVILIDKFAGIAPAISPRRLPEAASQTALNTKFTAGTLQPINDYGSAILYLPTVGDTIRSIYKFGGVDNETLYWFRFGPDTNVVRGPVANDDSYRTYFSNPNVGPRVTDLTLALSGGSSYPVASRPLGVPAPTAACNASTVSFGESDDSILSETRVYTYTNVNDWGEESAPAPASQPVEWKDDGSMQLYLTSFQAPASSEYNITKRRIYRSVDGTYLFVAEIPVATATFEDTVAADDLAEEIPSLNWDAPVSDLGGLIALPNGIMAGFAGFDVYLCEPYRPFAWPSAYSNTADYKIVGLGKMDTTLAVLTEGTPYLLQGSDPQDMVQVQADVDQACVSKRGIVSYNNRVYYPSPDGLMELSTSGSTLLTADRFKRSDWQALNPESIHAYQHDNQYVAFYTVGGYTGGFVYDFITKDFSFHDIYATAGYSDLLTDTLYLAFSNRALRKWDAGAAKSFIWKSKKFTLKRHTGFGAGQVEAEAYPVTAKFYADGSLVHTEVVSDRGPFRLPPGEYRDWEVEVTGSKEVFHVAMASMMSELAGV